MRPTLVPRWATTIIAVTLLSVFVSPCAAAKRGPRRYLDKPDGWFAADEAKRIAENILSFQADAGGWPKNIDTTAETYRGGPAHLRATFDNGVTSVTSGATAMPGWATGRKNSWNEGIRPGKRNRRNRIRAASW